MNTVANGNVETVDLSRHRTIGLRNVMGAWSDPAKIMRGGNIDVSTAILFALLGWLLGLVGPAIQEGIRLRRHTRRIVDGIRSELLELRANCSSITVTTEAKAGRLTKQLLAWHIELHGDRPLPPPLDQLGDVTKRLQQIDDSAFNLLAPRLKSPVGGGLNLKELALPYTQTKVTDLALFPDSARRRILDILSRIHIFNQQVEDSRFFFKLTFDGGLSEKNHASASAQVQASYDAASQQSRLIVEIAAVALSEMPR